MLGENCWWYLFNTSEERKANAEKSWGNVPQPLQEAGYLEIEFVNEIRKRKGTGAESCQKVKGRVFCAEGS